jgi:prepilin-type N-terminal cleavage/methylation domain-containing protein
MRSVNRFDQKPAARGFSLIEMMVVIVIVSIVIAAVLTQVNQTQQRASAEQGKLDQFQAARNFVDQISTDARQMGYPNLRNFDVSGTAFTSLPLSGTLPFYSDSNQLAAGLLKLTNNQLIFEGDVDGSGKVRIVTYTINGDGACATCLERAQVTKTTGTANTNSGYLTWAQGVITSGGAAVYSAEIQNVQNATSTTNPIFKAYDDGGNPLPASMDFGSDPTNIAKTRTIQITLDVSDPTKLDPKTGQALEATITSRVQVVNCSMATTSAALAAAGIVQGNSGIQLACQ